MSFGYGFVVISLVYCPDPIMFGLLGLLELIELSLIGQNTH